MAQDGSSHVPESKTEEATGPEDSKVTLLTFLYTSCWSECSHRTSAELERGPFPGGSAVKTPPANAGNVDSVPGSGRSPGGGNGNPLLYSCLENPMDGGAWRAAVHGVVKNRTQLGNRAHTHANWRRGLEMSSLFVSW